MKKQIKDFFTKEIRLTSWDLVCCGAVSASLYKINGFDPNFYKWILIFVPVWGLVTCIVEYFGGRK